VWILGVCYKNGEGTATATAAAAAGAEAVEDERVVVSSSGNGDKGGASSSTSSSGLDPEVAAAAASDWASIPWMTYRKGFSPIREDGDDEEEEDGEEDNERKNPKSQNNASSHQKRGGGLTSDVGWGCTLRSGQMLLAAAAQRVAVGRHWRRETTRAAARARLPPALEEALALFADEPGAPLSIHSLLAAPGVAARLRAEKGRRRKEELEEKVQEADRSESGSEASSSSCGSGSDVDGAENDEFGGDFENDESSSSQQRFRGLTPGEWLGPSTFCRAAEAALTDAWPSSFPNEGPPMRVLVVGGGGGGAPALDSEAAAKKKSASRSFSRSSPSSATPLLVLIPVQAGLGRFINPVYAPQVAAALRWPQSVGVVGGRRGASLYFAGTASLSSQSSHSSASANERSLSSETESDEQLGLLYLDPHVPRPAVLLSGSQRQHFQQGQQREQQQHREQQRHARASRTRGVGAAKATPPTLSAAASASRPPPPPPPLPLDPPDFFSDSPPARPLPLSSADPSLALGFLCADDDDYGDLVARASRLAARNPRWPLVSVAATAAKKGRSSGDEGSRRRRSSSLPPLSQQHGGCGPSRQEREDAGDWELL